MKRLAILVTLFSIFTTHAHAQASEVTGKVQRIMARSPDGLIYVVINGAAAGRPACAANHPYYMIADEHSDIGKSQVAILLSAYMSGKPVSISGTGTCTRWPDGEDIAAVVLE